MMSKHLIRGCCALKHWILEHKSMCFTSKILDYVVDIVQGHQIVLFDLKVTCGIQDTVCYWCYDTVWRGRDGSTVGLSHPWLTLQTTMQWKYINSPTNHLPQTQCIKKGYLLKRLKREKVSFAEVPWTIPGLIVNVSFYLIWQYLKWWKERGQ